MVACLKLTQQECAGVTTSYRKNVSSHRTLQNKRPYASVVLLAPARSVHLQAVMLETPPSKQHQVDVDPADVALITQELERAEAELASMFQPGRLPPRAGAVKQARDRVSALKAQLAALLTGKTMAEAAVFTPQAGLSRTVNDSVAEKARQALLEVDRSLQLKASQTAEDDAADILRLEAENEWLRQEARALLLRQQQLEEVVDQAVASGRIKCRPGHST